MQKHKGVCVWMVVGHKIVPLSPKVHCTPFPDNSRKLPALTFSHSPSKNVARQPVTLRRIWKGIWHFAADKKLQRCDRLLHIFRVRPKNSLIRCQTSTHSRQSCLVVCVAFAGFKLLLHWRASSQALMASVTIASSTVQYKMLQCSSHTAMWCNCL